MNKEIENLGDIFIEFGNRIKQYQLDAEMEKIKDEKEQLYSITEVEKIYPKLSKYILTKAINEGKLPVTFIGNVRHFYLKDIDTFLENNTQQKLGPNSITSWRTIEQNW